jgi:hypothetical protein
MPDLAAARLRTTLAVGFSLAFGDETPIYGVRRMAAQALPGAIRRACHIEVPD